MTTINDIKNSLTVALSDLIESETQKSTIAAQQFEQSQDADYKAAMQKAATKSKYVAEFLATIDDKELSACVKHFALDAVIDCCADSYSMKKLRALVKAIAANDKSKLSVDNQLATFASVFALASDEAHMNAYRKECKSARQLQMNLKMFERLSILKREKRDSKAFDTVCKLDSKARKIFDKLFD